VARSKHLTKPADAFQVGDRIRFKGQNATVTERFYTDDRRSVSLGIRPDEGGPGDRLVFRSGELVEAGDPLPFLRRLRLRLKDRDHG
jgi:hypothetical protein